MLGIDKGMPPVVTGSYADEVRDTIRRIHSQELNEADKQTISRSDKIVREYNAIWK